MYACRAACRESGLAILMAPLGSHSEGRKQEMQQRAARLVIFGSVLGRQECGIGKVCVAP